MKRGSVYSTKTLEVIIERKKEALEKILNYSKEITEGELHVLYGSELGEKIKELGGLVSLNLYALALSEYCDYDAEELRYEHSCHVGREDELKVVYTSKQKVPLLLNSECLLREREELRENELYVTYHLEIRGESEELDYRNTERRAKTRLKKTKSG